MSSASEDLLQKMRQDRQGQEQVTRDPYVKLLVFTSFRRQFWILTIIGFCIVWALISRDYHSSKPWWSLAFPITSVGLLLCLFPRTEMWQYAPWQSRTRRYERHQIEK